METSVHDGAVTLLQIWFGAKLFAGRPDDQIGGEVKADVRTNHISLESPHLVELQSKVPYLRLKFSSFRLSTVKKVS